MPSSKWLVDGGSGGHDEQLDHIAQVLEAELRYQRGTQFCNGSPQWAQETQRRALGSPAGSTSKACSKGAPGGASRQEAVR